ncbi:DDHD domain protein [Teladorsagia circumcincta]|uniref:DDHD domain protein n=1 Tax=Teladorsagia circumcincta TaxID=45464 RepID=A0A2G9USS0_TELCI|nr:DDHD domain protein [Teladorsagia circumcincta]
MNTEEVPKVPEKSYDDVKQTSSAECAPSEAAINSVEEVRNQLDNNNLTSEKEKEPSSPPSSSAVDNSSVPPPEETAGGNVAAPPPAILCDESAGGSPPSTSRSSKSPAVKERSPAPSPAPVPPARTKKRKVTDFRCAEVRWFYRRNEADKWINFNGRDSLCLEAKYRSVFDIPLDDQMAVDLLEHGFTFRQSVVVLEGLYKANDELNKVEAIYWKGDSCEIRRGTWFLQDWQPLEPPVAEAIEAHHLQYFRGQAIPEGLTVFSPKETSNKPQLTELQLEGMEIRWSSVIDVSLSFKRGAILRYIGWGKSQALRRGFHKEAEWDDGPAEISHLILVVHGIGQKGYENLIAENAQQVREAVVGALERCYPEEKGRPMFLPVEWRSILKLDDGITDVITLPKMSSMRNVLNSTAMDIMYYQSPLYRKEIVGGVVRQMNRIYKLFTENNPNFSGPVSIFAHSLGVINVLRVKDTHLKECTDPENIEALKAFQRARNILYEKIDGGINKMLQYNDEELMFKVKYLFAVGSPLAVFLVMRGATHADLMPAKMNVERIFNIFHPYDPVAYRLEPMFVPEYRHIRPVKLFTSHDLRARGSYDELPLDVYKSYMKKLKNEAKAKKNKPPDARSGGDDDMDEEDDCDSDYDARSGCSSPRCVTPPVSGDAASIEKPAKKGWFSSFTTAAPKKAAAVPATAPSEPTVEVAKEAEVSITALFWMVVELIHLDVIPVRTSSSRPLVGQRCPSTTSDGLPVAGSSPRCVTPPVSGDAASIEKPAKKGWFSSFTTAAPKKAAAVPATAPSEPTVEVAKEAESELPLADRLLGNGVRPPHRMDFQLQPALTDKSYWSVLKSHFAYWTNADLAVFVANILRAESQSRSNEQDADQAQAGDHS